MADGKEYLTKATDDGSVNISEDVVGIIALEALRGVEGFGGIVNTLAKDLADLIGKKNMSRGVQVCASEDSVAIDVFVSIRYGYSITKVSRDMQETVQKAVGDMTGIPVTAVNVHVCGVAFDKVKQ